MVDLFAVYSIEDTEATPIRLPSGNVGGWSETLDSLIRGLCTECGGEQVDARSGKGTRDLRFRFSEEASAEEAADAIEKALADRELPGSAYGTRIIEPQGPGE